MSLIEVESATFTWPGAARPAVRNLDLRIEEGEYVAIVGRNGSGKSSLLRLLNGLRKVEGGSVKVAGLDASEAANAREIRSTLVLVFQSPPDQIVSTIVEEDIAFGPENLGLPREEVARRVDEALAVVGLEAERRSPPHFLSAGQQQRLAVAGALAMRPRCIAFDEATAMLDPPSRLAMLDLMERLHAQGVTIIHVTHDMDETARAGRAVAMDGGAIVFDGTPSALQSALRDPSRRPAGLETLAAPESARLAWSLDLEARRGESAASLAARISELPRSDGGSRSPIDFGAAGDEAGEALFVLDEVRYSYLRGTTNERRAVKGASLSVPRGALAALVGKTGAGKSSLLQLMDALAFPERGRVLAFGDDTASSGLDLKRLRTRAPLSVQKPETALFELYAGDDVAFGPRNLGRGGAELVKLVREAMNTVGLPFDEFRDRGTRGLSGGEKRRLALAGILALDPEALLLDEPTAALDPAGKAWAMELILGLKASGKTVVISTHSMEEAALADIIAVVSDGRVVASGSPVDVFYRRWDPSWGIGRPFACEVALGLGSEAPAELGWPLGIEALVSALRGDGSRIVA